MNPNEPFLTLVVVLMRVTPHRIGGVFWLRGCLQRSPAVVCQSPEDLKPVWDAIDVLAIRWFLFGTTAPDQESEVMPLFH